MKPYALVEHLLELQRRQDRGALADLRRGLGKPPGTVTAMYPHVVPFVPEKARSFGWDWPYYTVAALFALHPEHVLGTSFGRAMAGLPDNDTRDLRLRAVLGADATSLPGHLRQCVSLLRSHSVGLDYHRLLNDLTWWSSPEARVQKRWGEDYWTPRQSEPSTPATVTD